ncbi:MAG: replication-associated recombination protein A [Candidatus Pacebacteria bacterium]|nr:replication-associated recombination protein A [Candidatus Paceibacterota bacterium]
MESLFSATPESQEQRPLADRLRPANLAEVVGQDHLLAATAPIGRMVAKRHLTSMILWGPPGCGKTTLARLLASASDLEFVALSAIFTGVADLRKIFDAARSRRLVGRGTLLFIDEIHRFNRAQQDGFLPFVEDGTVVLVGATTENPSFELNGALLSRCQVFVLKRLDESALQLILARAASLTGRDLPVTAEARELLVTLADGDGRYLLNLVESLYAQEGEGLPLDSAALLSAVQRRAPLYDKDRDEHYNLISALHKSLRGSDPDAALYWLARMLAGGDDPLYIARRLVRFATEDIALADPQAVTVALNGWDIYERLGSPEGELALAGVVLYLATAPKSNAAYLAFKAAQVAARETGSLMPPAIIRNAPTRLMKQLGYGVGYQYDHDEADGFSGQNYFPDEMPRREFYVPFERGFEREVRKRLDYFARLRERKRG